MGVRVTFEPATVAHAEALALTMRPEDLAEVQACGYATARDALIYAVESADIAWAASVGGEVAALFGIQRVPDALLGPDTASIWFLTGTAFLKNSWAFVRCGRQVMAEVQAHCSHLVNLIDVRYSAAARWAKWLGFQLGEPVPFGPDGMLFYPAHLWRR